MSVGIIDYGAGNLKSIGKACLHLGSEIEFLSNPKKLDAHSHIILPGVGSFGAAMGLLEEWRQPLRKAVDEGKPMLGVCLGIQLIFEESSETKGVRGLGLLEGNCERFSKSQKVPHMGWNDIKIKQKIALLEGIENGDFFYFVHSYYAQPKDESVVAATCTYEQEFPAIVAKDNLFATQFHPEKSGEKGLLLLKNFLYL